MTFPNFEDWKAPWEADGQELDEAAVKRLVYNLKKSEADQKAVVAAKDAEIAERDDALKVYRDAEEAAKRDAESDAEKAARERAERDKADAERAAENELLRLRLETGLSEDDAKRVVGSTYEEKLADAKALSERLKPLETDEQREAREAKAKEAEGEELEEGAGDVLRRAPVRRSNEAREVEDPGVDVVKHVRSKSSSILAN